MNKNNLIRSFALGAALLSLASCDSPPKQLPYEQGPIYGATIGGPFTLTDQNGKRRSYDEFNGKYRMVYFGYTSCPDICTPDVQNLMAGLKLFEKAEPELAKKVQPLFITIDPQRDTPAVLTQFVRAFHPNLIGLTGSKAEIDAVSKSFAVVAERVEGSSPENYLMSHSQTPYLMLPDGKPVALLPVDNPKTEANEGSPQAVVAELVKWVR
ncbi:SCO family protein [Sphingorhabdus arenilitoris]|uniref:SCO family protein n=1 Tax=Sphingorhabdus arenilitoris TaxID=1490041 RepID=A0ABV8RJ07_9SPHN